MIIDIESYFNSDKQKLAYENLIRSSVGKVNKVLMKCNRCYNPMPEPLIFDKSDLLFLYSNLVVYEFVKSFQLSYLVSPVNQCPVKANRNCLIFKFIQILHVQPKLIFLLGRDVMEVFGIYLNPLDTVKELILIGTVFKFMSYEFETYLVPFVHPYYLKRNSIKIPFDKFVYKVRGICDGRQVL